MINNVWLVHKIRLIVPIVLTSLLTSLFLLVQLCLLESSCYSGLSEIAANHRRVLSVIAGSHLQRSTLTSAPSILEVNESVSQGMITSAVESSFGDINTSASISYTSTTSEPHMQNISTSRNGTNFSSSLSADSTAMQHEILPVELKHDTVHVSTPLVRQLPKSAITMLNLQHCKQPHCMESISTFDKVCYDYCVKKQRKNSRGRKHTRMHGECRFIRGEGRAAVALASLPGSGNTWIRGLLEKATGVCTGSVYCDVHLKEAGFNGEEIRSGSVLVVKTHKTQFTWTEMNKPRFSVKDEPSYGAVVLLLRNPYRALVAEWNRKETQRLAKLTRPTHPDSIPQGNNTFASHTGSVGSEHFGTNPAWNAFIHQKMQKWMSYIVSLIWETEKNQPKLVVRYEDFQRDRVREVSRILDFLYFPYTHETLAKRLKEDFDMFRRNRHADFETFTESQEHYVEQQLREILDRLSRDNDGVTFGIEEYLRNP